MKNLLIAFTLLAAFFTSCQDENLPLPQPQPGDRIAVRFSVYADQLQTRTNENSIADLNIYLVDELTQESTHYFMNTTSVQFFCHKGNFRLYIIANAHADLGKLSAEQIKSYTVAFEHAPADLVMTAQRTLTLEAADQLVELPAIEVKRFAAKINFNITVDNRFPASIRSVQLMNVPLQGQPFIEKKPNLFIDAPIEENRGPGDRFNGAFYMLPNCQGSVATITDQKEKNFDNAPRDATFLRIRAMRDTKVLDYYVFLGENNTDNFDVRANTAHTLNITLRSENETDVRIRSYSVHVESHINVESKDNICLETGPIQLTIDLTGQYQDWGLYAMLELKEGNSSLFAFQGVPGQKVHPIPHFDSSSTFQIDYIPQEFTRENMYLKYTVSFYDRFGLVMEFDFSHIYAYALRVYTQWFGGSKGFGTITSEDAAAVTLQETLSSTIYNVFCPKEGCTIKATPDPGKLFDGFWFGHNHTWLITMEPSVKIIPEAPQKDIYAFFK